MTNTKRIAFEDALEEDDFGLIIGKDGSLKGMFVPTEYEDEDYIPEEIAIKYEKSGAPLRR